MKQILTFPLLLLGCSSFSQSIEWARNFGGPEMSLYNGDRAQGIAIDANSNIYTTGYYQNSADFGGITLTNPAQEAVFVTKQDDMGNVIWAKGFNAAATGATSKGIKITADNAGNIYTTGKFYGNVEFGGQAISPLGEFDPNSRADIFVAKQDPSGNVSWLKKMGGSGVYEEGSDIVVDNSGNVYICGHYTHSEFANFPSEFGNIALPSTGSQQNIFITKLDASGQTVWAKAYGSQNYSYETASGIAIDDDGNLYVTGQFSDTMIMDGIVLTAQNSSSPQAYVAKINNSGVTQWAVNFKGDARGIDLAHNNGQLYVTGTYETDMTVGTTTLTRSGPSDIFVINLNANTGSVGWAQKIGNNQVSSNGYGIAVANDNAIYVTGSFNGTLPLGNMSISSSGSSDALVIRLDGSGTPVWGKALGGNESDIGTAIAASNDLVHVAGYFFGGPAQFGNTSLNSFGGNDVFVVKLKDDNTTNIKGYASPGSGLRIYPNPSKNVLNMETKNATAIRIVDISGKTIVTRQLQQGKNAIDVTHLPGGIYFIQNEKYGGVQFIKE